MENTMGEISTRAAKKVSGPAWDAIRPQFQRLVENLLSVSSSAYADLTTIYIKFTLRREPSSPVYAVVWVKSSKRLVIGLALPEGNLPEELGPAPSGMTYKGLTGYFAVEPNDAVPVLLSEWAMLAYQFVVSQEANNV